jgi:hypothetical protein
MTNLIYKEEPSPHLDHLDRMKNMGSDMRTIELVGVGWGGTKWTAPHIYLLQIWVGRYKTQNIIMYLILLR